MAVKQRVSVHKHGERYFVGVDTFFASHPGSTSTNISEVVSAPTDEELGGTVLSLLNQSGVLDLALVAKGEDGRSHVAAALELPSDSALLRETVLVSVTRKGRRLLIGAMPSEGAGGGFGGDLETVVIGDDVPVETVGSAVREAADRAEEASAGVLRPAGSWRGEQQNSVVFPSGGVVTLRRVANQWSVTARIGARGGGQSGLASSTVERVPGEAPFDTLGKVVVDVLARAGDSDLQTGEEDPTAGDCQVLIEAGDHGLTMYPQMISPDTGVWVVPAHQSGRIVPRAASLSDIGQAVSLTADDEVAW
ncbi:hypothetical protein JAAN108728_09575 [Janibacter anophelis]